MKPRVSIAKLKTVKDTVSVLWNANALTADVARSFVANFM
jgi:hypothetical protein